MATNTSAPLPDLTLERKAVIQIDTGDANALITGIVIHFSQEVPETPQPLPDFAPLFVYEQA